MGAADAGPMEIQLLVRRDEIEGCRGCAGEHTRLWRAAGDWLERKGMAKTVVDEADGKDLRGGKVQRCGACRSTWSFVVGGSLFMPQR